ncbi:MAG: hypothetical protein SP1CHLAM54_02340 [Chlamydiia bacterium]|nr:hypothetical protein [Chlamydiia bacterium]MCH9615151.1 hypothetical protein [Chlamydiia bacterium]MCH9628527.1 hypothetical protein [Chlamydiia bacterium]
MFALLLCSICFGAKLDKVMPKDIQKKTGVDKLSPREQAALADYIADIKEEHVAATSPTQTQRETQSTVKVQKLTMQENLQGGKLLKLSDGSIWQVNPSDLNISRIWLFPFEVEITRDPTSDSYPYMMKNLSTGTSVNVRKL